MDASKSTHFTFFSEVDDAEDRFQKITEIRELRFTEPADSPHRMGNVCQKIPETIDKDDGYHRDCYQRFIMNFDRLKPATEPDSQPARATRRTSGSASDHTPRSNVVMAYFWPTSFEATLDTLRHFFTVAY